MTHHNYSSNPRSEKGIALIVVLLLMAVLSGLATGFAMNGKVESRWRVNETYYAGARAAAEAGMNRAVEALRVDNTNNLLAESTNWSIRSMPAQRRTRITATSDSC